jgi:SAM-dependent methyltransferase
MALGREWYDMIGKSMGGYVSNWSSFKVGISGEDVFENELKSLVSKTYNVLDAGCGHGEFTMRIAPLVKTITGFDFSAEMTDVAHQRLKETGLTNVQFAHATAKELPFEDEQFDFIYNRRGPTSVLYEHRVLKPGGLILGIHSAKLDQIRELLEQNGFTSIVIREYTAVECFPTKYDFAQFLMRMPGETRNLLAPEHEEELRALCEQHITKDGLSFREWRFIWKAVKS